MPERNAQVLLMRRMDSDSEAKVVIVHLGDKESGFGDAMDYRLSASRHSNFKT